LNDGHAEVDGFVVVARILELYCISNDLEGVE
jgi:hypothetical protein